MGRWTVIVYCVAVLAALSATVGSADTFSSIRQRALVPPANQRTLDNDDLSSTTTAATKVPLVLEPLSVTAAGASTFSVPRGGNTDTPTTQQVAGVGTFILIEVAVRKLLQAKGIKFPGQLAGCVVLFLSMILAQVVSPGLGDAICGALSPGAGLLAKWMAVFFVPGLVMLPLAPSLGSSMEVRT
jgi:hypothetical protein